MEWLAEPMSEFKFACPVCGQHITADSSSSGSKLECPTCFRKIVVPQAPAEGETKFILSASQADKPRPTPTDTGSDLALRPTGPAWLSFLTALVLGVVVLGAGGAAFYLLRGKLFLRADQPSPVTNQLAKSPRPPRVTHPVPTNTCWTLDLTNAIIPEMTAAGSIHGDGFLCERASLQGGNLSLRQGHGWPPDLGLNIVLFAKEGEELSGKTVEVTPDRLPPLPKITLRWKDIDDKGKTHNIASGYALKVVFGLAANKRITGKLYLGLPDEAKSFVAGTFDAEIRPPPAPKPPKPKAKPPVASGQ